MSGIFLALYFVAGVAGLPLWVCLARRIGRVRAWLVSMVVACIAFVFAISLGAGDVAAFAAVCLLTGLALGADLALLPALLADIAESPGGERRGRGYFGWWNPLPTQSGARRRPPALPLLALLGYEPAAIRVAKWTAGADACSIACCRYSSRPPLPRWPGAGATNWRCAHETPMLVRARRLPDPGLAGCAGISVERYRPNSRCSTSRTISTAPSTAGACSRIAAAR